MKLSRNCIHIKNLFTQISIQQRASPQSDFTATIMSFGPLRGADLEGECIFCPDNRSKLNGSPLLENDLLYVIDNRRPAGTKHWLIIPHAHIRDSEQLALNDVTLLEAMKQAKDTLLQKHCPDTDSAMIHTGYHRGHRPLFGTWGLPDIISVHHLHLHVIIEPRPVLRWLKYPAWNPLMWINDDEVLARAKKGEPQSTVATPVVEESGDLRE